MSRKIVTSKIARVEGNGGIEVVIDDSSVKDLRVNIYEGPRLIEEIVKGKNMDEVLSIVPRICAICNLSHRRASLRAIESALNVTPPRKAKLFRDLMHFGEMIESHTLHVYLLALPDFFNVPSAIHLVETHGDTVVEGLKLKKFGNLLMDLAGGSRKIHGENPKVGGFGKYPSIEILNGIKNQARELLPNAVKIVDLLSTIEFNNYARSETIYISVDPPENKYDFYSDQLMVSNGKKYPAKEYMKMISERVVSHSFAKRSLHEGKPYTVGALARILNYGDRLEGKAKQLLDKYYTEEWALNPLYNNMAQAIETVYCIEKIPSIVDELIDLLKNDSEPNLISPTNDSGEGVGAVEAPRGLLIHHYSFEKGLLKKANIITPTAQNLDDIERYMRVATENMLFQKLDDEIIRQNLEILVRSYDPCISCSAHMVKLKREKNED